MAVEGTVRAVSREIGEVSRHRRRLGGLESADMHRCVKTGVGYLGKIVVSIVQLISRGSIVVARRQPWSLGVVEVYQDVAAVV